MAAELGVTKAGLHYHFAGKAELGEALVERYARRFAEALTRIDERDGDVKTKLRGYADLYAQVLRQHRMCLCGMLASDYETLPGGMQGAVRRFFEANESWLAGVLEAGRRQGLLRFDGEARDAALLVISTLEGAMLVARPYDGDDGRFDAAAKRLLASLSA